MDVTHIEVWLSRRNAIFPAKSRAWPTTPEYEIANPAPKTIRPMTEAVFKTGINIKIPFKAFAMILPFPDHDFRDPTTALLNKQVDILKPGFDGEIGE